MATQSTITGVNIAGTLSSDWGITACEYIVDGMQVDLQDLLIHITKSRAAAVEGEIQPMSARMRQRNKKLENLGVALGTLNGMQAQYTGDDKGEKTVTGTFTKEGAEAMLLIGISVSSTAVTSLTKTMVEQYVQLVKNKIDQYNNASQTDMTRLQSLVDRRDQSYTAASDLMTSVSDTRSNLFGNIN